MGIHPDTDIHQDKTHAKRTTELAGVRKSGTSPSQRSIPAKSERPNAGSSTEQKAPVNTSKPSQRPASPQSNSGSRVQTTKARQLSADDGVPTKPILLFKYGGNAMTDAALQRDVLNRIATMKTRGYDVVIVHGGGPFIQSQLTSAGIVTEFIDGHRVTSSEAYTHVEMALKGQVNSALVGLLNSLGHPAVGLSGKDGQLVTARKRWHQREGSEERVDLGHVGDVDTVEPHVLHLLLRHDYIPVVTCLATDEHGNSYNINGDMFAGHLAGALQAREYIILTDVDGLLRDRTNPRSLIRNLPASEVSGFINDGTIAGGMIPKIESCMVALGQGCAKARILNGTQPDQLDALHDHGTTLTP